MAESLLARLHEAAGAEHEGAIEDEKQWTLHFRYIILPIALFQTHYIVNLLRSTASANAAAAFRGAQVRFAVLGLAWCIAALWVEFKLEKGNQFYAGPDYVPVRQSICCFILLTIILLFCSQYPFFLSVVLRLCSLGEMQQGADVPRYVR